MIIKDKITNILKPPLTIRLSAVGYRELFEMLDWKWWVFEIKKLIGYLGWVLWSSEVKECEETMANEQRQNREGYQIDEITYAKGGRVSKCVYVRIKASLRKLVLRHDLVNFSILHFRDKLLRIPLLHKEYLLYSFT